MITSRRTFGLLCATTFFVAGTIFQAPQAVAGENQRHAQERIPVGHARRATTSDAKPRSMVAQAATGRFVNDPPEAPLDGTLVKRKVRTVGFLETYGSACGPVCDCGSCGAEPVCGIEEPVCGIEEPVCGIEEPVCGIEEAVCGVEGVYHEEHGYGYEIGCGIGAMFDGLNPWGGGQCSVDGCTDCCDSTGAIEGIYVDDVGCGIETIGDCSCDACSSGDVDCLPIFLPFLRINWARFDFFAGVQGYKGPLNFVNTNQNNPNIRGGSGSFGFYQGFNEGRSLKDLLHCNIAAQFGVRATQSNISGAEFTNETRHQVFVTGGLFRRVDYGLQYGVVVDYLNDDWYFQGDSVQVRSELSWRTATCHVCGFQAMAGVNDDNSTTFVDDGAGNIITSTIAFEPTDQYRLFYRRLLNQSGHWNAFAGWTDRDDGVLGADLSLPLRHDCLLSTGTTYLVPREGSSSGGNEGEVWNISLGLVYRPGGPKGCGRYCRPMFDVADNGSFMIDLK